MSGVPEDDQPGQGRKAEGQPLGSQPSQHETAGYSGGRQRVVRPRCLTCPREGHRHRSRDGELRVRDRPRKRRPPQGHRPRVVVDAGRRAPGASAEDDLRGRRGSHRRARAGCGRARGVVRRRRRPHRALRRSGARRRARRGRARRHGVHRVRARPRQAGGVRLRPRREGAGAADGEGDPRARRRCRRRTTPPTRSPSRSAMRSRRRS